MFLHFFFSSKVTFRRIKMQKTKIIRLLSILHEIACFLPLLTRLFINNKILGTSKRISAKEFHSTKLAYPIGYIIYF